MRSRAHKRRGYAISTPAICIAMVLLFSALGVSYAHWADGIQIVGTVSTGNLDIVFDGVDSRLTVSGDKKTLTVDLQGVTPASSPIVIPFQISNEGGVPCGLEVIAEGSTSGVGVSVSIEDHSLNPGGRTSGVIRVNVSYDAQEKHPHSFSFGLRFQQSLGASY